MLVLVRRQRHYIAADCDALRSFVLTSGDYLATTVCSQLSEVNNRSKSAQTNANIEWPPPKEHLESSSRKEHTTHGPPHNNATPHQGFM
jgi:hypothetical protein